MKQQTLAGFEKYGKNTRRAQFLAEMDRVVPWAKLAAVIEPFYPQAGPEGGRPPIGLERMLRIYFLQQWFNLSDPAVEEALYDWRRCAASSASTWVASPLRMRPPCASSVIGSSGTASARSFFGGAPVSERERPQGDDRHHRRRHHHQCAVFDQETGREA